MSSKLLLAIMIRRSSLARLGRGPKQKLRHIFPLGPLAVREAQGRFARILVMDHVLYLEREDLPGAQQTEVPDVTRRGRRPVLVERRVTDDAQESRERERERPADRGCPAPVAQVPFARK